MIGYLTMWAPTSKCKRIFLKEMTLVDHRIKETQRTIHGMDTRKIIDFVPFIFLLSSFFIPFSLYSYIPFY
jgi:hypothetical protein